jgi:hypothetical protein
MCPTEWFGSSRLSSTYPWECRVKENISI